MMNKEEILKQLEELEELEGIIGYSFKNKELLKLAMTHSSYANEHNNSKLENNERLEFLGDAVLELTVSSFLYNEYKNVNEGELTKTRASMVCEPTLFLCAQDINLSDFILLGKGEEATGGRKRPSIVSDAMEALIGAIYLDSGIESAKTFITKYILNDVEDKKLFYDSKTILQEITQGRHMGDICYELISEEGPDHNKIFNVALRIGNKVVEKGSGKTKKAAEQEAAYKTILKLRANK